MTTGFFTVRDTTGDMETDSLTDQYSIIVWLAALLVGLLTIPVGLLIGGKAESKVAWRSGR